MIAINVLRRAEQRRSANRRARLATTLTVLASAVVEDQLNLHISHHYLANSGNTVISYSRSRSGQSAISTETLTNHSIRLSQDGVKVCIPSSGIRRAYSFRNTSPASNRRPSVTNSCTTSSCVSVSVSVPRVYRTVSRNTSWTTIRLTSAARFQVCS